MHLLHVREVNRIVSYLVYLPIAFMYMCSFLSFGCVLRRIAFAIILFILFLLVVSIRSLRVVYCKDHGAVHQAVPARFANCPSISTRLFIFKPPVVTPIVVTPGLFKTGGAVVR